MRVDQSVVIVGSRMLAVTESHYRSDKQGDYSIAAAKCNQGRLRKFASNINSLKRAPSPDLN